MKMKIVLLGEGRVGKTSVLRRFVNGTFDDDCESTTKAAMYATMNVVLPDSSTPELCIWDTAGQERYHALGPIYYRDADGAILVYDITDYESFLKVKVWVKELHQVVGNHKISIVIVGNKIDLERQRCVPLKEAEEVAQQQNALHFSVSAKLGIRITEPFEGIARSVVKRLDGANLSTHRTSRVSSNEAANCKVPVCLGSPPSRLRGLKIRLSDASKDEVSTKEGCTC